MSRAPFRLLMGLVLVALGASVTSCCIIDPEASCSFLGKVEIDLVLKSLDGDRIPLALVADADKKDVKRKDRASYGPSKGEAGAAKKRFVMTAKKNGAAATECIDRPLSGDSTVWVRIALDKMKGIEDGVSAAFLERRTEDGGPVFRVEAVYNAAIQGFTTRARVDGATMGSSVDFAGVAELFLLLDASGTTLRMSAAPPTTPAHDGLGPSSELFSTAIGAKDRYRAAIGVSGLGKKGTFYFAHFTVRLTESPVAGPEGTIAISVVKALWNTKNVAYLLGFPGPHALSSMNSALAYANVEIQNAIIALDEAGANTKDPLDPTTNAKKVRKSLLHAAEHQIKAINKLTQLIEGGKTNAKSATKNVQAAADQLEVALGQLMGFQGSSPKTLSKTIDLVSAGS